MKSGLHSLPQTFAALADPTRLRIVGLLLDGEVCVCHIYETLKIPQPKASRHLAYLRRAGLVEGTKRGLWVYYRLARRDDEASRAIMEAVRRTLQSQEAVTRDRARLRRTICCVPAGPTVAAADARPAGRAR